MNDPDIERWLRLAEQMRSQGNHDGAVDALRRVLARDPDHGPAHASLAHTLLAMRRLPAAEHEIALALRLEPDDPTVLFAAAAVTIAARRLDDAEELIDRLLAVDPADGINYILAAQLCMERRRFAAAEEHLDKARELAPTDPDVLLQCGELAILQGKLDEAETWADEALEASPEHAGAHLLAGRLALRRGRLDDARAHALFAMRGDPGDPEALWIIAGIKARRSPILGLWWRLNVWLSTMSDERLMATLLAGFLLSQVAVIVFDELDAPRLAAAFHWLWLGLCAYTWFGPALFRRSLEKELETVELDDDY
jgi:tetratricopeptide (TPR) repeat protein